MIGLILACYLAFSILFALPYVARYLRISRIENRVSRPQNFKDVAFFKQRHS